METPPTKLYKYFSPSRSRIFDDWNIRFSQPGALNDPFEMRPHIAGYGTPSEEMEIATNKWEEHTRSQYDLLVKRHGARESYEDFRARAEKLRPNMIREAFAKAMDLNEAMAKKIDEMINAKVGILSLSSHPDSLLMWPHYGDSHRGFVIEFDTSSPFFNQQRPPDHANADDEDVADFATEYGRLRVVHYSDERPSVVVTKLTFDLLLTKGLAWKYEDEWRMLMPLQYANEQKGTDSLDYPIHLFKIPPSAVTKIILGCSSNDRLAVEASRVRERQETAHISIVRARIDERHFELKFEPM